MHMLLEPTRSSELFNSSVLQESVVNDAAWLPVLDF